MPKKTKEEVINIFSRLAARNKLPADVSARAFMERNVRKSALYDIIREQIYAAQEQEVHTFARNVYLYTASQQYYATTFFIEALTEEATPEDAADVSFLKLFTKGVYPEHTLEVLPRLVKAAKVYQKKLEKSDGYTFLFFEKQEHLARVANLLSDIDAEHSENRHNPEVHYLRLITFILGAAPYVGFSDEKSCGIFVIPTAIAPEVSLAFEQSGYRSMSAPYSGDKSSTQKTAETLVALCADNLVDLFEDSDLFEELTKVATTLEK